AQRFPSSLEAVEELAPNNEELYRQTRLWHDTWYDSTLPYWLLDRTFLNTSTLATGTCLRFGGGRFYGWEGVGCCAGTCSHVWQYAQAVGRVFPELERITRENVDYGLSFHEGGQIDYRGEFGKREAIDGQCGTILRVLREHQMSADDAFLKRIWPRVRQSIEFLIAQDADSNGVLEAAQYNTLDAEWYGPISWISSLYLAALRAGAAMADDMADPDFAQRCRGIADRGAKELVKQLFNGEYFYQRRDPAHPEAFGAGIGCHIDQVFGQGWAWQVGLPRVLPPEETVTALRSLWRYNFTPDVGPYRQRYETGRWYAMPGEAGLIMCTFPKGGEKEARGDKPTHGFAGYFNECMNGFEYQAAGHMIAEGLVDEGLAVTRAIHDRYHPSRRNPYNEVECGDHYARSMASYGVYVSVCGFQYHGPRGQIGFAPKISPDNFRAAFIAAEGWGTFQQKVHEGRLTLALKLRSGQLRLKTASLAPADGKAPTSVKVALDGRPLDARLAAEPGKALVELAQELILSSDEELVIDIS
ncbi:MAG: GH116 family glycosyl hydrolase, partial [Thermoguttaceae bacterium]